MSEIAWCLEPLTEVRIRRYGRWQWQLIPVRGGHEVYLEDLVTGRPCWIVWGTNARAHRKAAWMLRRDRRERDRDAARDATTQTVRPPT